MPFTKSRLYDIYNINEMGSHHFKSTCFLKLFLIAQRLNILSYWPILDYEYCMKNTHICKFLYRLSLLNTKYINCMQWSKYTLLIATMNNYWFRTKSFNHSCVTIGDWFFCFFLESSHISEILQHQILQHHKDTLS